MEVLKRRRWTRKASFSVEVSVIMCSFMLMIGGFLDLSIQLYRENLDQIESDSGDTWMDVTQALRIRHIGGSEYEKYRIQHNF